MVAIKAHFFYFMAKSKKEGEVFNNLENAASQLIDNSRPYLATVKIVGTAKKLFHCWKQTVVDEKASSLKNSTTKKTDDIESYVIRNEKGLITIPTANFCASIRYAGKAFADPSSPRKSMYDKLNSICVPYNEYALINDGVKTWDYVDARRVVIQRAGITRQRPGFNEGWTATFKIMVLAPDFLPPARLREIMDYAGKFQGIGDFRPSHGRFRVDGFSIEVAA